MFLSVDISSWLWLIFILIYAVSVISCIIVVLSENRNPIRSLSWVLALIFLPYLGLIVYLFFGRSMKGMHMLSSNRKRKLIEMIASKPVNLDNLNLSNSEKHLIKLSHNLCNSIFCVNNEIDIYINGKDKFDQLKRDLRNAKAFIFIQYYIFSDDNLGNEIAEILKDKARSGVEVRVIYDYVGSFKARNRFFKEMQQAGVDTHPFFKVTFPQLANRINWRNHRKIVVIDNEVGYIGGMNIADRYVRMDKSGSGWRDTHFRVKGDIVESLLYSFVIDWQFRNKEDSIKLPPPGVNNIRNELGMQLVLSGPIGQWDNLALCFLKAIGSAKKSIYIQTPYFLPTDALIHALEAASLSQIDVRIMIPRWSDSWLLRMASFSYVTQCLKAGIKIYLYEPEMLHVKAMIIDETMVTAGSTNFDFRSFENNFESNLFIYDREVNRKMRDIFFADIKHCKKLTYSQWHARPRLQRTFESVIRLMSPIL